MSKIVIGLTGPFGSGCTTIAERFIQSFGYKSISLSKLLRSMYKNEHGFGEPTREYLQEYGNEVRKKLGPEILARKVVELIDKEANCNKWVVDSIRNPYEVEYLRRAFSNFYLIGVYADKKVRWERVKKRYDNNYKAFEIEERRDWEESLDYGQRVQECFLRADIVVVNNGKELMYEGSEDYRMLEKKVLKYIGLIEKPFSQLPSEQEAIMAIAYANGQRSSCLKRKVGAVIVDKYGNLFSSGYNEVPFNDRPCLAKYNKCYRETVKDRVRSIIYSYVQNDETATAILNDFPYKMLEYCRALHAEESAILNVARFGSSIPLAGATLFTTTYPCNLCANKIAQVKIGKVVYLEPYPMEEAKEILASQGIDQEPFEGVAFRGYFRLYGGVSQ